MKRFKKKGLRKVNQAALKRFSENVGIIPAVVLIITVVKDFALFYFEEHSRIITLSCGIITTISLGVIFKINPGEKISNHVNLRKALEVSSFTAVVVFILENLFLDTADEECVLKLIAFIVLIVILFAIYLFCIRKDRNYNID